MGKQVGLLLQCVVVSRCSVLQCAAVRCSVLQCTAVCCGVLRCVAMCCSVLRCVAVCFGVLQCAASRLLLHEKRLKDLMGKQVDILSSVLQ